MKLKYFIFCISLILVFLACDVTDRVPDDAITDRTYWRKTEDLKMYTRYFYSTLSLPNYHDGGSDMVVPNSKNNYLFGTSTVPQGDDGWSYGDWANIRRCNYFLTHYQTVEGPEMEINHYVGEARFFRANEYFNKLKQFGDVPWYDRDIQANDKELLYKERDPRSLIVSKIVEDLEFAANNMMLPSKSEKGQLHKYAAYQLLARVCLFEASWMKYSGISGWEPLMKKASDAAKIIMDSGLYDIVKGTAKVTMDSNHPLNYKSQFITEDLTGNKECILPRIYIKDILTNNISRIDTPGLSKDFIEQFLCVDGLPISLSGLYMGDDSIPLEITNRDPRLWNIIDNSHMPVYMSNGQPTSNRILIPTANYPTGYTAKKFQDPDPVQQEANSTTADWFIYRYAETLLIYAEAKAELGECNQAVLDETINKLRARLDQPGQQMGRLTVNPPADPLANVNGQPRYGYAVSPLLYEIRRERLVELCFENFRWDDICRWRAGKLIENPKTWLGMVVSNDIIARYTAYNNNNNPFKDKQYHTFTDWDGKTKQLLKVYNDVTSRIWNDRLYLSPLPKNQLTLNPQLKQNPGWGK